MKKWINDIYSCPINKRVHFLCRYGETIYEIIGTLTTNLYNATIIRGECIDGNPEIFYRSELLAWAAYC